MIKTITEYNQYNNKHIKYTFNTKAITERCCMCGCLQTGDLEQNYVKRGNYCASCNARY
jgi:hypothetical protein